MEDWRRQLLADQLPDGQSLAQWVAEYERDDDELPYTPNWGDYLLMWGLCSTFRCRVSTHFSHLVAISMICQ
jgi:hypothetical protein